MSAPRAARSAARRRPMRWREPSSRPGDRPRPTRPMRNAARNLATNSIGATGKGVASTGSAVSTSQETMIPLSAVAHFTQGATPLAVNHQGLLVANTISFNLPPNVSLSTAVATIEATMNRIGVPATDPRHLPGYREGLSGFAQQPALSDPGGPGHDLHRARRAVRKLRSSADNSVHIAVCRRRRAAGADGVPDRIQHHGADRRHPADRHREEECDHDDRFRARRGTNARAQRARRDLRGLPAALQADHDDDHGGACSARFRWRSAWATAASFDNRSVSRSSAASSSARC